MLTKTVLAAALALWCAGALHAQSLGDLSREERTRKGEPGPQSGKVYTNEDIPQPVLSGTPPPAPAPSGSGAAASAQLGAGSTPAAGEKKPAAGSAAPEKSQPDLEKEYRDKFAQLRSNLDFQSQKLDVMQRELNLSQQQYYANPQTALMQETFRTDINKRTEDIEAQKVVVEKANQAIADLEEELRKKGLPPGWARETSNTSAPAGTSSVPETPPSSAP